MFQPFLAKLLNGNVNLLLCPLLPLGGYTDDGAGFLDLKVPLSIISARSVSRASNHAMFSGVYGLPV